MRPSRKYLSLPIISLKEGLHIGYVKNLVLNSQEKTLAALVVDPKGFFKDQKIIPYNKVVSVGDDAITIDKSSHVEKATNIPEILDLVKEKINLIGSKIITETGKTLGVVDEYYIDPESGKITGIEISGGKIEGFLSGKAYLSADHIVTIGQNIIISKKGSENELTVSDKGLTETLKAMLHTTSQFASETTQSVGRLFKKDKAVQSPNPNKANIASVPDSLINNSGEENTKASLKNDSDPTTKEPQG